MQKWNEDPGNAGIFFPVGIDGSLYRSLLRDDSARLFERSTIDIDAFHLDRGTVNNSDTYTGNTSSSLKIPIKYAERICKYDLVSRKIDDTDKLAAWLNVSGTF